MGESKIKARVKEKSFLEYLLARMFYLTKSFSDINSLVAIKNLVIGGMKSVKMFIPKYLPLF